MLQKSGGGGYSYKDIIRGIKIPLILQIYSFILSKRVRLVFYELSLSQGRRGLSYLEDCDLFVSVCVGEGGGNDYLQYFLKLHLVYNIRRFLKGSIKYWIGKMNVLL